MSVIQRTYLFIIVLALLALSFNSQSSPALYKIEKNNISTYLFGTVHVGDASMKGLPTKVIDALNDSSTLIVEVDISSITPLEMQRRSMPFMLLNNGKTLKGELSSHNYEKLKRYFTDKSIDISMFSGLKPWAVMLTMMQIEFQNMGFSDKNGIDKQILTYAKNKKMAINELETLEQQMEMFDHLSLLSDNMITDTFEQLADVDNYFYGLVNAYKAGDMATLSRYYNESFDDSEYGKFSEQIMLAERNNNWVKQLSPRIGKEQLFIAVGALHLPEQYGLLKQFKDLGFTVTRL